MSQYQAFRRQPVAQQVAQNLRTLTFPAPTRGLINNENEAYMQPGGAQVQDNWAPTMRGVKLRGGVARYCDLHSLDFPAWTTTHAYVSGNVIYDPSDASKWGCAVNHTSAGSGTFAQDRAAHPGNWVASPWGASRLPVISSFEYAAGNSARMFAAQATKLFDVTTSIPVLVKSGQASGNYVASQLANAAASSLGTNWMVVCNDAGDSPLRFNGTTWQTLDPTGTTAWANNFHYVVGATASDTTDNTYWKNTVDHTSPVSGTFAAARAANPTYWTPNAAPDGSSWITGPLGSNVVNGKNLTYVWKYRNRLFFIENNSMNAWYLAVNAVGGTLSLIPLAGAATKGGKLLYGATWSLDAGDGIDEKCIFATDQGELIIFTGSNPSDPNNWAQQGRYQLSAPLGMNAHIQVGGDLLVLTVDGIIPLSQAITKDAGQLELAMLTRTIKTTWRAEVNAKRAWSWTIKKWDEYGALFVTTPGDVPGSRHCLVANNATGAWCRFLGSYDATCFIRMRADMFFGTQDGFIMQSERTGKDETWDAARNATSLKVYVASLVGGWETFGAPANQIVWRQARASFRSQAGEPFAPQLDCTVDYHIVVPMPPPPGVDPGVLEVWDQGKWDAAHWDQPSLAVPPVRNTMWVSVGRTGFAHAPIVQVSVCQQALPDVELIAISATYEPAGVNV
jgi:hypothetical protein